MTGYPRSYYMGIGKNGSSKRSINLAGFPQFSKKNRQERKSLLENRASQDTTQKTKANKLGQQKGPPNLAALIIWMESRLDMNDRPFACSSASLTVYFLAAGFFAAVFLAASFLAATFLAAGFFAVTFLAGAASSGAS